MDDLIDPGAGVAAETVDSEIRVEQRLSMENAADSLDLILYAWQSQRLAQNRVPLCGALKCDWQTSSKLRARRPHGPIRHQHTCIDRLRDVAHDLSDSGVIQLRHDRTGLRHPGYQRLDATLVRQGVVRHRQSSDGAGGILFEDELPSIVERIDRNQSQDAVRNEDQRVNQILR